MAAANIGFSRANPLGDPAETHRFQERRPDMNLTDAGNADIDSLPPALEQMVVDELAEREKLAWVGRPRAGRMALASIPVFLFGIPFTGFSTAWTLHAMQFPSPMALAGVPFIAVGLGMLASPIWAGIKASRTCYAVTSRRAITWEPGLWDGLRVRSYVPEQLVAMSRTQRADGSGDLIFEEYPTNGHRGRRQVTRHGFFAIESIREVEALIRSTLLHR